MNKTHIDLWYASPDDLLDHQNYAACESLLNTEERSRIAHFRFESLRREYVLSRALSRIAISQADNRSPEDLQFATEEYGKPQLHPASEITFNLSNCPKLVVCAVTQRARIGVDAEPFLRSGQILEVAQTVFAPMELEQLRRFDVLDRQKHAVALWTLKESYIKAKGQGFSLPLQKFWFTFDSTDQVVLHIDRDLKDDPARWRFCLIERAEHSIAIMIESTSRPFLRQRELRDFRQTPMQPTPVESRWFPALEESS